MFRIFTLVFIFFIGGIMSACTNNGTVDLDELDNQNTNSNNIQNDNEQEKVVKNGDTVEVDYIGRFPEGEVFDTSIEIIAKENDIYNPQRQYKPIEFKVGAGGMIKGFEQGVLGMKVGETKTLTIPPEQAYGTRDENAIVEVPKQTFDDAGIAPEVGMTYNFQNNMGKVLEIGEEKITIDFNHPMADKTLEFEITLKNIK